MKGPYMANIGKKKHVLEKTKNKTLSNFLLNLILNFDFSKSHPCKSEEKRKNNYLSHMEI